MNHATNLKERIMSNCPVMTTAAGACGTFTVARVS